MLFGIVLCETVVEFNYCMSVIGFVGTYFYCDRGDGSWGEMCYTHKKRSKINYFKCFYEYVVCFLLSIDNDQRSHTVCIENNSIGLSENRMIDWFYI